MWMKTTEGTFMFVRSQKRHEPKRLSDNHQNFFSASIIHQIFGKYKCMQCMVQEIHV